MTNNNKHRAVIDTNVFMHMFNPRHNEKSHIESLLISMQKKKYKLSIDNHAKITGEYAKHLLPLIKKSDDVDVGRFIIKYWMDSANHDPVEFNLNDPVFSPIDKIIPVTVNRKDRYFIATAILQPCNLVSNDDDHIISNRTKLRNKTKRWHRGNMRIRTSLEAAEIQT